LTATRALKWICVFYLFWTKLLAQTVVPITSEPDHHLVLSNDYVRVFQVEVPPKSETFYHQHDYDYLYVAIGDADVTSTRIHEAPVSVELKDGDVELAKGPFAHKAANDSDQPFRNVTIELLHGTGKVICTGRQQGCGLYVCVNTCIAPVIVTERFRADDWIAKKGSGTAPQEGQSLVVALSQLKLSRSSQSGTDQISLKAGDVVWNGDPGTKLQTASNAARFILISFSPAKTQ
jgi:quercetin dioxygenase-like cupin family protein